MSKIWTHPKLGELKFDHQAGSWDGAIKLPAFDVFTYERSNETESQSYGIGIQNPEEGTSDPTLLSDVDLLVRVVEKSAAFPELIVNALWEDFNGRGPASGMWWRADLSAVADDYEPDFLKTWNLPKLDSAKALYGWMKLYAITVRRGEFRKYDRLIEFSFTAFYEIEHNVGVLTDGNKIIGMGYAHDCQPYTSYR